MSSETKSLLVDVAEAGALLRCSRSLIYRLIAEKRLPTVKLGRSMRLRRADVERLAAGER